MMKQFTRMFSSTIISLKPKPVTMKFKNMPLLLEEDLEESFTRGTGPGGQKVNKTSCVVLLKHRPTGLTVRCQETRYQSRNRIAARKLLRTKLDNLTWGDQSTEALKLAQQRRRGMSGKKKTNRKYRALSANTGNQRYLHNDSEEDIEDGENAEDEEDARTGPHSAAIQQPSSRLDVRSATSTKARP